jgi:predicted Na+-dependent transporter
MRRLLTILVSHATLVLPSSVAIGLLLPELAAFLRPAITPLVWGILTVAMIRTDWPGLRRLATRPVRVLLAYGFLMMGLACLVAPTVHWLGLPAGLALSVSVMCLCPPITSAPALAPILGLNQPLSLVAAVAGLLLAPLTLPPLAFYLLGLDLDISVLDLMARLGTLVGSAFVVALVVRIWLGPMRLQEFGAPLDGVGMVFLVIFAIAIFDGVTEKFLADPVYVLIFVGGAFAAHAVYQAIGIAAFLWMGRRDALTVGFLAGTRNMGLLLAVLPASADPGLFLYIATTQFPIYIMPTLLRPIYRHLLPQN